MKRLRVTLLCCLTLALGSCIPGPLVFAVQEASNVPLWGRLETWGFVFPTVPNPFDPSQIQVEGEFRAPDGSMLRLPGYVTRDYTRALVGGFEHLTPRNGRYWRVRFTPTQEGAWQWRWTATTLRGTFRTPWRDFAVTPAAPTSHGLLRVSADDPRYLRFDDGTPWLAIGENVCWYDGRGTFSYDDWFAKLAAQGVTFVRLWMPSWAFALEWTRRGAGGALLESSLGDYGPRLDRAWQLDYVLDLAARHGLQVMLSIQNHGAFSTGVNSEWADNPYNAANGGPLARPEDFFTDPEARALFKRRLRYVVARWGAAPNLMAWELWNEVDLADQPAAHQAVLDWHAEMAAELRALDPYGRLVTTSTSLTGAQDVYDLPEIDLVQWHFYSVFPLTSAFSETIPFLVDLGARPGKPTLVSEMGVDTRGPVETLQRDPGSIAIHDGLWAGALSGSAGTGMTWWWDNVVDPEDLYPHFGAVARFVEGVAFDRQDFVVGAATATAPGRRLRVLALRGRTVALAWMKNARHEWFPAVGGSDPSLVLGASVTFPDLPAGEWWARWIDAYAGSEVAQQAVSTPGGAVTLAAPPFAKDVALRLERTDVDPPPLLH